MPSVWRTVTESQVFNWIKLFNVGGLSTDCISITNRMLEEKEVRNIENKLYGKFCADQICSVERWRKLVINEIKKCKNNKDVRQVGIEWTTMQSKELIENNVKGIHYYTYGSSDNVKQIVENVF